MDLAWDMSEDWLMNVAWCRYETHSYFRGLRLTWDTTEDGIAKVGMGYLHMCVLNNYLFW